MDCCDLTVLIAILFQWLGNKGSCSNEQNPSTHGSQSNQAWRSIIPSMTTLIDFVTRYKSCHYTY